MKKKVLFFIESLSGGGAEKVLTDIVKNINKEKFDITVGTVSDNGIYVQEVKKQCRYFSVCSYADYEAGGIRKLLFSFKYKLLYSLPAKWSYRLFVKGVYDTQVAFVEGFATKLISASPDKKSKKLAWVHIDMSSNPYADSCYKSLDEHISTYQRFDKILCVSQSVKAAFCSKFGITENVEIQYNPVDSEEIIRKSAEPIDFAFDKNKLNFVTVGRLAYQKGYDRLLKTVCRLKNDGYTFCIHVLGDGEKRVSLESYVRENHLEGHVVFHGYHTNPYKYVAKCDAFICSSYAEGFSTAATESIVLGKPVLTVECAGMRELFGGKNCGIITENTDEALYGMLKRILDNPGELDSFNDGINVRKKDFDITKRIAEAEHLLS